MINQLERLMKAILLLNSLKMGTTIDGLQDWVKPPPTKWVTPEKKAILMTDLSRFEFIDRSKHIEFQIILESLIKWACRSSGGRPQSINTWGDAVHAIFDSPVHAAGFALSFQDAARAVNWRSLGLSADTGFRAGLHFGNVQRHKDKVLGRKVFVGESIIKAARIEPVGIPGQIVATEAFANALNAANDGRFECTYVGERFFAKSGEKKFSAYRLTRRSSSTVNSDTTSAPRK